MGIVRNWCMQSAVSSQAESSERNANCISVHASYGKKQKPTYYTHILYIEMCNAFTLPLDMLSSKS